MRSLFRFASTAALTVCALLLPLAAPARETGAWPTFAHDQLRTGLQSDDIGITRSNASRLGLRWAVPLGAATMASPVVGRGLVFVATTTGYVYALRSGDGTLAWETRIGHTVRGTPALADGLLFVGDYGLGIPSHFPQGAALVALDAATGRIRWRTPTPGVVRSPPVIADGVVYEGIAGGDPSVGCTNGRILAFDERTGRVLPRAWYTTPRRQNGGGIWGPLSYDRGRLYFGTGNTCDETGHGNSIIALDAQTLHLRWSTPALTADGDDEDVGGGVALLGKRAYVAGKSGFLYILERERGTLLEKVDLHPDHSSGGPTGTPTSDGETIVTSSGDGASIENGYTTIQLFDLDGRERARIRQEIAASPGLTASFVPGVGFSARDRSIIAFDAKDGSIVWSHPTKDGFYAAPALAAGGLYDVDYSGNVYAFGVGATGASRAGLLAIVHKDKDVRILRAPERSRSRFVAGGLLLAVVLAFAILAVFRWFRSLRPAQRPLPGRLVADTQRLP